MKNIQYEKLSIEGLKLIRPAIHGDSRGHFLELFRSEAYLELGIENTFVQDNCSVSKKGVIRGMHYQRKPGQAKLVTVLSGTVFDVVVDMRPSSPTFGKWEGVILSEEVHEQLFIPIGFAHGFCVLSDSATVFYKVSAPFDPKEEKTFRYDDEEVGIKWPIMSPVLSVRDQSAPKFTEVVRC